jgi:predicted DCC family thiol-disulfide oxidoreductase YuxK
MDRPVLFFDGTCVLCNGLADFILRVDRKERLGLATLQGLTAAQVLEADEPRASAQPSRHPDLGSVVLWEYGRVYRKSEAVIHAAQILGGGFRFMVLLRLIPRTLRDLAYDVVARNRLRWFGQRSDCRVPTSAERARFFP